MQGIPVVPLVHDGERRHVVARGFDLGVRDLEVGGAVALEHVGRDEACHRQDQPTRDDERHDEHDGPATVVGRSMVTRSVRLFAHHHVDEP